MEHSLRAYLERQSTEELDRFLQETLSSDAWKKYDYVIPIILEVLADREEKEYSPMPEHILKEWVENELRKIKGGCKKTP